METMEDWDKMKEQIVEESSSKDNGNFLWHLVMEIRGQIEGDNSTSISHCRVLEFVAGIWEGMICELEKPWIM